MILYIGSRKVNGKTPYVLECTKTGYCKSLTPRNVYFINAGYDSSVNKLIRCQSDSCDTITAVVGYYLAYNENGVLHCTSSTTCSYHAIKYFSNYLNAGAIGSSEIIIQCLYGKCITITPSIGYYITNRASVLIHCTRKTRCSEITASEGYYISAYESKTIFKIYIIHCVHRHGNIISCKMESANTGFYISNVSNTLISCDKNKCTSVIAEDGVYRSATTFFDYSLTTKKKRNNNETINEKQVRKINNVYNIISCTNKNCNILSPDEIAAIPICNFNNEQCFIDYNYSYHRFATTYITAGGFCTNDDRSIFYFATDSIVLDNRIIGVSPSTFIYTTTTTNCLKASKYYSSNYYPVGSAIYRLNDNQITKSVDPGYYFINIIKNTLIIGHNINEYNNKDVKIYKCNSFSCNIIDKPTTNSFFVDKNKHIIRYTAETQKYSYIDTKDITCIYHNHQCTPKYDMEEREFCITYLGELVLASKSIKSHESGNCYKSKDINRNIYGYSFSNHLYHMDQYSASQIDNSGYYIVTKSSNYTATMNDIKHHPQSIILYGCIKTNCKVYSPKENIYYYDIQSKSMYRFEKDLWQAPAKSGYAYISIHPNDEYIYKFTLNEQIIIIEDKVSDGFYYTVDEKMYKCEGSACQAISDSDYIFTNDGVIYYCEYDSKELEETECTLQSCISGQYYYINDYYYQCSDGNHLKVMTSKLCNYENKYIINFPTFFRDDFPKSIQDAVNRNIRNNGSSAISKKRKNFLTVVPAVYTHCQYNVENGEINFELICVNNIVKKNITNENIEICSLSNMGYITCTEDSKNPNKCILSLAIRSIPRSYLYIFNIIIITLLLL